MNKSNRQIRRKQSLQFSNRQLTSYQWALMRKMNIDELIAFYKEDPEIVTHQQFYLNVKSTTFETMLKLVFSQQQQISSHQKAKILELIAMIKGSTSLIENIIQDRTFDKMLIFGFLDEEKISETTLSIFGDIFVGFSRTCPNKLIEIIKDESIQYLFTNNMKKTEVYKIIYTLVFCLNKRTSEEEHQFIYVIVYSLLSVLFQNDQGSTIFDNEYWNIKPSSPKKNQYQNPKNRKCSEESKQLSLSTNQNQETFTQKLKASLMGDRFEEFLKKIEKDYEIYFEQVIEISDNIAQMFEQLTKNLPQIYKGNVQALIDIMSEHHFISKIFIYLNLLRSVLFRISKNNDFVKLKQIKMLYKEVQSNLYKVLNNILQLNTAFDECFLQDRKKGSNNSNSSNYDELKPRKTTKKKNSLTSLSKILDRLAQPESQKSRSQVIQRLKMKFFRIIKQISQNLAQHFKQANLSIQKSLELRVQQLSGIDLDRIEFSKFWIIKILIELFQIVQQSFEPNISSLIGIENINPFVIPFIRKILQTNKWNNIMHNQIKKLFQLYIDNQYIQFFSEIQNEKNFSDNFLGFIVSSFRNKNHVFLNTMKMCHQGDQHILFTIAKYISGKLSQKGCLKAIMEKFPVWKDFIHNDLKKYQAILNKDGIFSEIMYSEPQFTKKISLKEDITIEQPLETIQQMIQSSERNKRWSTSPTKPIAPRRRKQSFNSFQAIKQIDSLRNFELNQK